MSHIYQPVMIRKLLETEGQATDLDIANSLLQYDPSQIEYYQSITNNMVGKVLRNHKIGETKIAFFPNEIKPAKLLNFEKDVLEILKIKGD